MSIAKTAEQYFDARSIEWESLYTNDPRFARRYRLITEFLTRILPPSGTALDVGCGTGLYSRFLARAGWRVIGVDLSSEMVERARKIEPATKVEYSVASLETFSARESKFDVVMGLSMMEYVPDADAALKKLASYLRPGGILVLSVPNKHGMTRRIERWALAVKQITGGRVFASRGEYLGIQRHQFTPEELDASSSRLGLSKIDSRYLNPGFSGSERILPIFEERWWAALYLVAYRKG